MGRRIVQSEPVIHLPAVIEPPWALEIVGTHPLEVDEGAVVVLSDCHYRADEPASTAHRACVELVSRFAETGTLRAVIINGDAADFPKISKHARIGWEKQPSVAEELAIVRHRMSEIASIAGLDTELVMTMGNHDVRLDTFLSQNAAAFEGVIGFSLRDHIDPAWAISGRSRSMAPTQRVSSLSTGTALALVRQRPMCSRRGGRSSRATRISPGSPGSATAHGIYMV